MGEVGREGGRIDEGLALVNNGWRCFWGLGEAAIRLSVRVYITNSLVVLFRSVKGYTYSTWCSIYQALSLYGTRSGG